jgi:RNA polymerase sigma factor (sigma-70 family)
VGDEHARVPAEHAAEVKRCYEANSRWLYGYARLLLGRDRRAGDSRATAEDLLQDTFVAATRAWATVRDLTEEQQRAWLRTTVSRLVGSVGRRNQKLCDLLPELHGQYASAAPDPEQQAVSADTASRAFEKIVEIIDGLPSQQRQIALMRWVDQMKNTEIAVELGTTPNVVAVQVNTIRRKLVSGLGPFHPFAQEDGE